MLSEISCFLTLFKTNIVMHIFYYMFDTKTNKYKIKYTKLTKSVLNISHKMLISLTNFN